MTIQYTISNGSEFSGASVIFPDGNTYPVSSDHPKYAEIVASLLAGAEDEAAIFKLVAPFDSIFLGLTALSDRVSRKGMKLFFDGDLLNNAIAKTIIESIDNEGYEKGTVWKSYVAFLERLMTNPSVESRDHFYNYVESHGLTITAEGLVVLYKGVSPTKTPGLYESTQAGVGVVKDNKGKVTEYDRARLPNAVGYEVSIPRALVDTNRNQHCSTGLHAGTFDYAKNTMNTGVLLTVLVDPRDVVSVPNDYNNAKVRLSRYTVIGVNDKEDAYKTGVVNVEDIATEERELSDEEIKIERFKEQIAEVVKAGDSLRKFRNKRVTSKNRPLFDQTVASLGLTY